MVTKDNDFTLPWSFAGGRRYLFAFFTLLLAILIIYSNSFDCSWHFDDYANIVENENVHMKSLSWAEVRATFNGIEKDKIVRPVAYLSLALNYYAGKTEVFGYHVVNLLIHCLASIFLFLFVYRMLNLPLLKERYGSNSYSIALLSTFLWAVNPVNVTSVTYIVQRMASMCGLFYIMAMYFYLLGRTAAVTNRAVSYFALCAAAGLLAVGTKENAVMLPVSLFFFDLFLIQGATRENVRRSLKVTVPMLMGILLLILLYFGLSSLLGDYKARAFSPLQRVLSQPRAILYYVGLLFYPVTSRLMLLHDFQFSQSLLSPWTTTPALLILFTAMGAILLLSRRRPLIAFCGLFFLLNHAVESSFTSLELVYEHRNYLPSMLLFVLPTVFAVHILGRFSGTKLLQGAVAFVLLLVIVANGHTTYLRNAIFYNEETLWSDNIEKAPSLARPHCNLSWYLFQKGDYARALTEIDKAIEKKTWAHSREPALYHFNRGWFLVAIGGDLDRALESFRVAVTYWPTMAEPYTGIGLVMLGKGEFRQAETYCTKAISLNPRLAEGHYALSLLYLKKGMADEAIGAAKVAAEISERYASPFGVLAEAYRQKGNLRAATFYWERVVELDPRNISAAVALTELSVRMHDRRAMKRAVTFLMGVTGQSGPAAAIAEIVRKRWLLPYTPDQEIIAQAFISFFREEAATLSRNKLDIVGWTMDSREATLRE